MSGKTDCERPRRYRRACGQSSRSGRRRRRSSIRLNWKAAPVRRETRSPTKSASATCMWMAPESCLNGKPIFLYGANAHAEAPYRGGRVSNDADVAAIFGFLKDLNANFVRLAHYPQDERMERMADRQGVMVWSEIPLWQGIAFGNPQVYDKAVAMLHEMIRRDRNKASVILWSVANETPNNPTRTEFLTNLANEARKLDGTRMITAALNTSKIDGDKGTLPDPLVNALDVIGLNQYVGWYTKTPEQADSIVWGLPQKPIIVSEFGAEAKQGNHGSKDQRWTEESQANVLQHNFAMMAKVPQVRGYAVLGVDGLPLADAQYSRAAGWLQPQGALLRRRQEEGSLYAGAEDLYGEVG